MTDPVDAVVVGSGPNSLVAAVTLARAGCSAVVLEVADVVGGGCRSEELTEPGFVNDVCAAIHPLGVASPAIAALPLADHGLEWVHAEEEAALPLSGGRAAILDRSIDMTADGLGERDLQAWRSLMGPLVRALGQVDVVGARARSGCRNARWCSPPSVRGPCGRRRAAGRGRSPTPSCPTCGRWVVRW